MIKITTRPRLVIVAAALGTSNYASMIAQDALQWFSVLDKLKKFPRLKYLLSANFQRMALELRSVSMKWAAG